MIGSQRTLLIAVLAIVAVAIGVGIFLTSKEKMDPNDPVNVWFRSNLNDPDSLQIVTRLDNFHTFSEDGKGCDLHSNCRIVLVEYRTKNKQGGMELFKHLFHIQNERVVHVWTMDQEANRRVRGY